MFLKSKILFEHNFFKTTLTTSYNRDNKLRTNLQQQQQKSS